jgi:hypothetical protein
MPVALLLLDTNNVASSLAVSAVATGILGVILGFSFAVRAHSIWRRNRPVQVNLPCQDAQEARFRLMEHLKFGFQAPPPSDGPFTIEPSNWRKKFGASPVTVTFPQPRIALVTGSSAYLSTLARRQKLALMPAPGSPTYWQWLKPKSKYFFLFLALVFIAIFLLILNDPNQRPASVAPTATER